MWVLACHVNANITCRRLVSFWNLPPEAGATCFRFFFMLLWDVSHPYSVSDVATTWAGAIVHHNITPT